MTSGSHFKRPNTKVLFIAGALLAITALASLGAYLTYPKDAAEAMNRGFYGAARTYLGKAAAAGSAKAQNELANLHYLGLGGERNHRVAVEWYLKSARQKYASAQINIARMYRHGYGVNQDVIRAFAWLRQARINGSETAENQMRWIAGSLSLGPNQIQLARDKYGTLQSLLAKNEKP